MEYKKAIKAAAEVQAAAQLLEVQQECIDLRNMLDTQIAATRRLERELHNETVAHSETKRKFAEYSQRTQSFIAGVEGWLDAYQEATGAMDYDITGNRILKAWVTRNGRALPEWRIDERGILSIWDDIPF